MPTTLYLKPTFTGGSFVSGKMHDMKTSAGVAGELQQAFTFVSAAGGTKISGEAGGFPIAGFYSERVAATTTISGTLTFEHYSFTSSDANATLQFELYQLLRGGTGEERHLGTFVGLAELTSSATLKSWSYTLPSTTLSIDERLILRVYLVPFPGLTMLGGAAPSFAYGNPSIASGQFRVVLPGTVTFLPNLTRLYFHRAGTTGISGTFDLASAVGSSTATTAVVNTVASGTEIQWSATAGGSVIAWASPRFARNFYISNPDPDLNAAGLRVNAWVHESATAANVTWRAKIWRRRPDGTETLILTTSDTAELGTSAAKRTISSLTSGATFTPTEMLEDDRLIVRLYIINVGVMGGARTATLTYDKNTVTDATGDSWVEIYETPGVKAEGDPAAVWTVPDGQSTMGVGN